MNFCYTKRFEVLKGKDEKRKNKRGNGDKIYTRHR